MTHTNIQYTLINYNNGMGNPLQKATEHVTRNPYYILKTRLSTPPMKQMVVCVGLHTYHEEVVPYFLSHVRGRFEDDGEGEGQLH